MRSRYVRLSIASAVVVGLTACETMAPTDDLGALRTQLAETQSRATQLEADKGTLARSLSEKEQSLRDMEARLQGGNLQGAALLPPAAKPGECYARVFTPATYKTVSKKVLHTEASEKIAVKPPQFQWVEEKVLVKEASKRLEVVPARYDWVEEQVMVKDAGEELRTEPAVYRQEQEKVLVREAYSFWKKGRGPIERVDDMTGEIMCLIEVPAEYKTVVKHVLASPARSVKVSLPAEYKTVRKRVLVAPAKTVEVEVPAEYETVRVKKMVTPPQEMRTTVPAVYQTVSDQVLVSEGQLAWRQILCETNTTPDVIRRLQEALQRAGYDPGRLDGVMGDNTIQALRRYQSDKGLPSGKLTLETLRRLGVLGAT